VVAIVAVVVVITMSDCVVAIVVVVVVVITLSDCVAVVVVVVVLHVQRVDQQPSIPIAVQH